MAEIDIPDEAYSTAEVAADEAYGHGSHYECCHSQSGFDRAVEVGVKAAARNGYRNDLLARADELDPEGGKP